MPSAYSPPGQASSSLGSACSDRRQVADSDAHRAATEFCRYLFHLDFQRSRRSVDHIVHHRFDNAEDKKWQRVFLIIVQFVAAEEDYFNLAFHTKSSFRIEHGFLKDVYSRLRNDLGAENEGCGKSPTFNEIVNHFSNHAATRIELISFYTTLPGRDWRSVVEWAISRLIALSDVHTPSTNLTKFPGAKQDLLECELGILTSGFTAALHLSSLSTIDALIAMKSFKLQLVGFVKQIHVPPGDERFLRRGFFGFFATTKPKPFKALINWLWAFYDGLVSKFSLYLYDTLSSTLPYSIDGKQLMAASNTLPHCCSMFVKRQSPAAVVVFQSRICDKNFFCGLGYNISLPVSGMPQPNPVTDDFPFIYFFTSDDRKLSRDAVKSAITAFMNKEGFAATEDSKIKKLSIFFDRRAGRKTLYGVNIERNIFMLLTFDREVSEKDDIFIDFLTDVVSRIRLSSTLSKLGSTSKTSSNAPEMSFS